MRSVMRCWDSCWTRDDGRVGLVDFRCALLLDDNLFLWELLCWQIGWWEAFKCPIRTPIQNKTYLGSTNNALPWCNPYRISRIYEHWSELMRSEHWSKCAANPEILKWLAWKQIQFFAINLDLEYRLNGINGVISSQWCDRSNCRHSLKMRREPRTEGVNHRVRILIKGAGLTAARWCFHYCPSRWRKERQWYEERTTQ